MNRAHLSATCTRLPGAALLIALGTLGAGAAFAESPMCGAAQDDSWMAPEAVQERVETLGYTIEGMGVSDGNCYELTGLNVQGESVTAYLDPRTGDIIQEDVAQ